LYRYKKKLKGSMGSAGSTQSAPAFDYHGMVAGAYGRGKSKVRPIRISLLELRNRYGELKLEMEARVKAQKDLLKTSGFSDALLAVLQEKPLEANFVFNAQIDFDLNDRIYLGILEDSPYCFPCPTTSKDTRASKGADYRYRLSTLGDICTVDFIVPEDRRWLELLYVGLSESQAKAFGFTFI
jgi:hypothetical protein